MTQTTETAPTADSHPREPGDLVLDQARAAIYGVLARIFDRETTPEFAEELSRIGFLEMLAKANPGVSPKDFRLSDSESQAVEFTRLFVGPGSHVSPYASVYRKDDKRVGELWGTTTGEVKRFMTHYGLELSNTGAIPDHISVLLEFMERVLRARIKAMKERPDAMPKKKVDRTAGSIERRFFSDYIQPWAHEFLKRVERAKPSPFYASVVKFTDQFLTQEREEMAR